jgi:hypothetical protein
MSTTNNTIEFIIQGVDCGRACNCSRLIGLVGHIKEILPTGRLPRLLLSMDPKPAQLHLLRPTRVSIYNKRLCHKKLCPENNVLHLMLNYELNLYWMKVCWLDDRS